MSLNWSTSIINSFDIIPFECKIVHNVLWIYICFEIYCQKCSQSERNDENIWFFFVFFFFARIKPNTNSSHLRWMYEKLKSINSHLKCFLDSLKFSFPSFVMCKVKVFAQINMLQVYFHRNNNNDNIHLVKYIHAFDILSHEI